MSGFFDYLAGYRYFFFEDGRRCPVTAVLTENAVPYTARNMKDGTFRIKIRLRNCDKATSLFERYGIPYSCSAATGVPAMIKKLRERPGFIVGLVLFFLITWFSSIIVWDIRIPDDCPFTEDEIVSILASEGFSYGTVYYRLDFDGLNSSIMANNADVAWISINMRGNVADVDVRRAEHGEIPEHEDGLFANVVAKEDAQIIMAHTDKGTPEVSGGDIVKKGDLLISGIVPLRDGGVRFVYADGEITADVNRAVSVRVDNRRKEKCYTGREDTDRSLIFFKKRVNLFPNGRIKYATYDKIEKSERLTLFGVVPLPVWLNETEYREYEDLEKEISAEESLSEAKKKLRKMVDEALLDAELISKTVTVIPDDDGLFLRCDMVCRTDIGEKVEFQVYEK